MNNLYQKLNPMANMMEQFEKFRQNFHGDARAQVQQMLNSGQITQEQFNKASQMANQIMRFMK